jgi:nuclear pore complex protein Nup98-Nup96
MNLDGYEKAFHDAGRPTWGPDEMLVVPRPLVSDGGRRFLTQNGDILSFQRSTVQTEKQELRLATFATEVCCSENDWLT